MQTMFDTVSKAQTVTPVRPGGSPAEDLILTNLMHLINLISKPYYNDVQKRFDLSFTQWRILRAVGMRPGASATEICTTFGMHLMNVSRGVNALVKRELITRSGDPVDRRRTRLNLTEQGSELFEIISATARNRNREVSACVSDAEWRAFNDTLTRLIAYLRNPA